MTLTVPQLSSCQAVVFDMDDTLYPEIEFVMSGFDAVAGYLAEGPFSRDELYGRLATLFEEGPRNRVFNRLLEEIGQSSGDEVISKLVEVYRCHIPQITLKKEVKQVLEALGKRYKLGLISDGYMPTQLLKARALGLTELMDHCIFTETLGREYWKPHPRAFEEMAAVLGGEAEGYVYVADNPTKDFIAPKKLGWATIQVTLPHAVHHFDTPAEGCGADAMIDNLVKLLGLLGMTIPEN